MSFNNLNRGLFFRAMFLCLVATEMLYSHAHGQVQETASNLNSNRPGFLSHNVLTDSPDLARSSLPVSWSPETVKWHAKIAGYGQSTPVVYGALVFITSVIGENKDEYQLEAFELSSGRRRWVVNTKNSHPVASTPMVSRSAPTPVVDDKFIYVFYESGDLLAVSHEGKTEWQVDLQALYGDFKNEFGLSASPVQTPDSVVVLVDHDGPSYLAAFDKANGKEKWRVDRGTRTRSWSSPGIVRVNDVDVIVTSSSGTIDAYHANTGGKLFTFEDIGGNTAATPIDLGKGQFLASSLIRPSDGPSENALESNFLAEIIQNDDQWSLVVKWIAKDARGSFCSPVASEMYCYFTSPQGILYCLDRNSGAELYHERLPCGMCWATPIVEAKHLYLFGKTGQAMTIKDGERFEVVAADNRVWSVDDPSIAPTVGDTKAPESIRSHMSGGTQYGAITTAAGLLIRRGDELYLVGPASH